MASAPGRGAQVLLDAEGQALARGIVGNKLADNIVAKDAAERLGSIASGATPDGSTVTGIAALEPVLTPGGIGTGGESSEESAANAAAALAAAVAAGLIAQPLIDAATTVQVAGANAIPRSLKAKAGDIVDVRDWGVKLDGVTDDTINFRRALAEVPEGQALRLGNGGTLRITQPIVVTRARTLLVGAGSNHTEIRYDGTSTNVDILTFGANGINSAGTYISGLRISSARTMTGGYALRMRRYAMGIIHDIRLSEPNGTRPLWNGIYFDEIDNCSLTHPEIAVQQEGISVRGGVGVGQPKAGLYIRGGGRILGGTVGLHVGGAFGGIQVEDLDIIECGTGILIDTALAAEPNREMFFGTACFVDGAKGSGLVIDQAIGANAWVVAPRWIASSGVHGIHVKNFASGFLQVPSDGTLFNNAGDAVRVDDASARVSVGAVIRSNAGYGINAVAGSVTSVEPTCRMAANTAGNFGPNKPPDWKIYNAVLSHGARDVLRYDTETGANGKLLLRVSAGRVSLFCEPDSANADMNFEATPSGNGYVALNGLVRARVWSRATLPAPTSASVDMLAVINDPPAGKSRIVMCSGSAWEYLDRSAV